MRTTLMIIQDKMMKMRKMAMKGKNSTLTSNNSNTEFKIASQEDPLELIMIKFK
jgi:hypothetical protein